MRYLYMTGYKVKGIKTLDQLVELSFYKKTITKPIDTREYNIKGIYGMNGSGKSGIVTSADILRKLLVNDDYLNNPVVQKSLGELVNKKTKELYIEIEYLIDYKRGSDLYRYSVTLGKDKDLGGKYVISSEELSSKPAASRKEDFNPLVVVKNGEITFLKSKKNDQFAKDLKIKTLNLLSTASIFSVFGRKIVLAKLHTENRSDLYKGLVSLGFLGYRISVYMEDSDNHIDYCLSNIAGNTKAVDCEDSISIDALREAVLEIDRNQVDAFSAGGNIISKARYSEYKEKVARLQEFVRIFKPDLIRIDVDPKEMGDCYDCDLVMVYDSYSIDVEFESTGIKKLIGLFAYLQEMVSGDIVFIDELDSNIHDVYLCALLEYLMDYGEGQLCFTTHNVGPMDVLKKHKKSIDFLSEDKTIYPWTTNGNYSPSKLYRSGMIEGSPFNVDSTAFIGIFDSPGEDRE